jgi:hypothetical protein
VKAKKKEEKKKKKNKEKKKKEEEKKEKKRRKEKKRTALKTSCAQNVESNPVPFHPTRHWDCPPLPPTWNPKTHLL